MDTVRLILPQKYDLVVGEPFQLFYRGIVEAVNPYHYDILSVCKIGKNCVRYFEATPTEVGTYPLRITVSDNAKNILAQGETQLCVHAVRSQPQETVNILCIGDSLTAGGHWVREAHRRLTQTGGEPAGLGIDRFRFIGTCHKGDVSFEGYGGWSWDNYLTQEEEESPALWVHHTNDKTLLDQHSVWSDARGALWQIETIETHRIKFNRVGRHRSPLPEVGSSLVHYANAVNTDPIPVDSAYSENPNPFCDLSTGKVDFQNYCQRNGFDGIDAVYVLLSMNGRFCRTESNDYFCQKLVTDGKKLVDILHAQYPLAKVKIMGLLIPSVNGGMGANYGAQLPYCDYYEMARFAFAANEAYQAWCLEPGYRDYMEFINTSGQFDADYNYPTTQKPVNTRSTRTETIGTNGLHPLPEGYLQIADVAYRNIVQTFLK